jgi:hypothetical protein
MPWRVTIQRGAKVCGDGDVRRGVRLSASAVLLVLGALPAAAQDTPQSTRVSPGGTTRVYIMAAFNDQCQTSGTAEIELIAPPAKGTMSLRPGQTTTVASSRTGSCIGARVQGTGVYYTARADAAGADNFTIRAKLPTGETAERTFVLRIED